MGTVLHVTVDDDVARRIDAIAARKATSRSAIVRTILTASSGGIAAGLEEYERTPELAICAYLPEGRFTVLFREYGPHNPRPEEIRPDPEQQIEVIVQTVLASMYLHYGARYHENPVVKRIRDRKRQEDLAAGHDSRVPLTSTP